MRTTLLAALLLASAVAGPPVHAEESAPIVDGRARADDRVLAIIANVRPSGRAALNAQDVRQIGDIFNADGKFDPTEIDLLVELTAEDLRVINIRPLSDGGDRLVSIGTQYGASKAALNELLEAHVARLSDMLDKPASWEALVRYSRLSSATLDMVRNALVARASALAAQSTVANVYKPARETISGWSDLNKAIAPDLQDPGRLLIHHAFAQADAQNGGRLPDFLYDWTKAKPAQ